MRDHEFNIQKGVTSETDIDGECKIRDSKYTYKNVQENFPHV